MIRGTRRSSSNRSVRNQNKLQKLRDKVRQSTESFMQRHQTLMASRLSWWRKAFRVPNISNWWVFSQARTLWAAMLAILGLSPSGFGSSKAKACESSYQWKRKATRRLAYHEQLEARQLLAVDLPIYPAIGGTSFSSAGSPSDSGQVRTYGLSTNSYADSYAKLDTLYHGIYSIQVGLAGSNQTVSLDSSHMTVSGNKITWERADIPFSNQGSPFTKTGEVRGRVTYEFMNVDSNSRVVSGATLPAGYAAPSGNAQHGGIPHFVSGALLAVREADKEFNATLKFEIYNGSNWVSAKSYYDSYSLGNGGLIFSASGGFWHEKDPNLSPLVPSDMAGHRFELTGETNDLVLRIDDAESFRYPMRHGSPLTTLVTSVGLAGSSYADSLSIGNGFGTTPVTFTGNADNDSLTGGAGVDTFNVTGGTDTINNLGNGIDIVKVSSGATVSATAVSNWTATAQTSNSGTAQVIASGFSLDVSAAGGTSGWILRNEGNSTVVALTGSVNNDSILGGSGNDALVGGNGDDSLAGGDGTNSIDGGAGTDTATFIGNYSEYTFAFSGPNIVVTKSGASTDTITNVEKLQFVDKSVWIAGTGSVNSIQAAVNATVANDLVLIAPGSYTGDVDASSKTIDVIVGNGASNITINGNVTLGANDLIFSDVTSLLEVNGAFNAAGATLSVQSSTPFAAGQRAVLVKRTSGGNFTTVNGLGSGNLTGVTILNSGGDGNDITIFKAGAPQYDIIAGSNAGNDAYTLERDGSDIVFKSGATVLDRRPWSSVSSSAITLSGGNGDDSFVVDPATIPSGGLTVAGGTGSTDNDELTIKSGGTSGTNTYNFDPALPGATDFAGLISLPGGQQIIFSGLEPIVNETPASSVVLNLPTGGNPDAVLEELSSNRFKLSGTTFEHTTFVLSAGGTITINGNTGTDSLTINAVSLPGNIDVNFGAGDTITLQGTLTSSGNVNLTAQTVTANSGANISSQGTVGVTGSSNGLVTGTGSVTLNAVRTNGGNVTLLSGTGGLLVDTISSVASTVPNVITLSSGGILTVSSAMNAGASISATSSGNLTIDQVNAATNIAVVLTSTDGSVSSESGGSTSTINASTLNVNAKQGVNIRTNVNAIEAFNNNPGASGNIVVAQTIATTLNMNNVINEASGGSITVTSIGPLVKGAAGNITAVGGDVSLTSQATIEIAGPVQTTGTGNVSVSAKTGASITVTGQVNVVGTGTVSINADSDNTSSGNFTNAGSITTSSASNTAVVISAFDMLLLGTISSLNGTTVVRSSQLNQIIALGTGASLGLSLTAAELNTITAAAIEIGRLDSPNTGAITIEGPIQPTGSNTLILKTASSITDTGTGKITETNLKLQALSVLLNGDNDVDNLVANVSGALEFHDVDDLTVPSAAVDSTVGITTTGSVTLVQDILAINGAVNSGTSPTTIRPRTSSRSISVGSEQGGELSLTEAELELIAASVVRLGQIDSGNTAFNTGNINLRGSTDIAGGSYTLSLITGGAVSDSSAGEQTDLKVANLMMRTGAGIGTVSDEIDVAAGNLSARNDLTNSTPSGPIRIEVSGSSTVATVDGVVGLDNQSTGSPIDLTSITGGNLGVNQAVFSKGGNISITSAGSTSFAADGDVSSGNGTISVNAATSITMVDGTLASAGTGKISLVADGNIALGGLLTTNSSNDAVTVTSTNGAITDAGNTDVDIVAATGGAILSAKTGIGDGNAIETTVAKVTAGTTGSGDIQINETNGIELTSVTTFNGDITVDAAGNIDAKSVIAGDVAQPGNIKINATSGSITVGTVTAENNNVELDATGDISGTGLITAADLNASAETGIDVSTSVDTLTVVNAISGDVVISEADGLTIDSIAQGGADVSVTAALGKITVAGTGIVTDDGDINLTADDMDFTGNVEAGAGRVTLTTTTAARPIWLGEDAGADSVLGLSDADLDWVITTGFLQVGSSTQTGGIVLKDEVTADSGYDNMALITGGSIADGTTTEQVDLTVQSLALHAKNGIGASGVGTPGDLDLQVNFLAALNENSGNITLSNTNTLVITDVDSLSGVTNKANNGYIGISVVKSGLSEADLIIMKNIESGANGDIELHAIEDITIKANVTAGAGGDISISNDDGTLSLGDGTSPVMVSTSGDGVISVTALTLEMKDSSKLKSSGVDQSGVDITVTVDELNISTTSGVAASIDAGAGDMVIRTLTADTPIDLGGDTIGSLSLSADEIAQLKATKQLTIGRDDASLANSSGQITITQAVSFAALAAPVVVLVTGKKIEDTATGSIGAQSLALKAGEGVGTTGPLTLAGTIETLAVHNETTGDVVIESTKTITIGLVAGVSGVTNKGGDVSITTTSSAGILLNKDIATDDDVTLKSDGVITMSALAAIKGSSTAAAAMVDLEANGNITLSTITSNVDVSVKSTLDSIVDDSDESTKLSAPSISLTAAKHIGGSTAITGDNVAAGAVTSAIDVDFDTLDLAQTGSGGNVQVRSTGGTLLTSTLDINGLGTQTDQLTVLSSAGNLVVDNSPIYEDFNVLLGTTGTNQLRVNSLLTAEKNLILATQGGSLRINDAVDSNGNIEMHTGTADILINAAVSTFGDGTGIDLNSGRNITIGSGVTLLAKHQYSINNDISISAGGNFTLPVGTSMEASDDITIAVGQGATGGTASVRGTVSAQLTTVDGGGKDDNFIIVPSKSTEFSVRGFSEASKDSLSVDTVAAGATIDELKMSGPDSGEFTFLGGFQKVTFVDIESIDDLPPEITGPSAFTLTEDNALSSQLGAVSSGGYSLTFLPLTYPANGTLKLGADGKFEYIPNEDYNNAVSGTSTTPDSFTYRVLDGRGRFTDGTISLTVTAANDAPVANDDTVFMNWNSTKVILPSTLLANDVDIEGDGSMTHITFGGVEKVLPTANNTSESWTLPNIGTLQYLVGSTGTKMIHFTPVTNYGGVVGFSYRISDGSASDTATVEIGVFASGTPLNEEPVASDVSRSVTAFSTLSSSVVATDADVGDTLTYLLMQNVNKGTLTFNANGTFAYTPNGGATESDSFVYRVSDGKGGYSTATVTLNIEAQTGTGPRVTNIYVDSTGWSTAFRNYVEDSNSATANTLGYPIPKGVTQSNILPWVNLNRVFVMIEGDVRKSVDASDFRLTGVSGRDANRGIFDIPSIVDVGTSLSGGNTIVSLLLNRNFDGGVFTLTAVAAGIFDTAGQRLDGEWVNNSSLQSGNGIAGGDLVYTFRVLPGDISGDGTVSFLTSGTTADNRRIVYGALDDEEFPFTPASRFHDIDGNGTADPSPNAGDGLYISRRNGNKLLPNSN